MYREVKKAGRVIFVLLTCFANTAVADFQAGMDHYTKGDYEAAYQEFHESAISGDYSAQYNLGVMYYQGQFVEQDVLKGYAWFSLAAQFEQFEKEGVHTALYEHFTDEQKQAASDAYRELYEQYGDTALKKALEPVFLGASPQSERLKIVKRVVPEYPKVMARAGASGWVDVFYTVASDGTTRDHVIFYSSRKHFTKAALKSLRSTMFEPATIGGQPVAVNGIKTRFNFHIEGAEFREDKLKKHIAEVKERAEGGDAHDKLEYGYLLDALPSYTRRTDLVEDNPNEWYYSAAQSGNNTASFFLGRNLLYGNKCEVDVDKSYAWLISAAKTLTDAQYTLALELLSGVRFEKDITKAVRWLERAANNDNANAQLKYAWILSTAEDESLRDGKRAAALFSAVDKDHLDRQTYYEVAAAVAAENGDFKAARKWQKKALKDAKSLDLPQQVILNRLAGFENEQPVREAI